MNPLQGRHLTLNPRGSEESALLEDRQSLHDLRQAKAANMGVEPKIGKIPQNGW